MLRGVDTGRCLHICIAPRNRSLGGIAEAIVDRLKVLKDALRSPRFRLASAFHYEQVKAQSGKTIHIPEIC